MNLTSVDPDEIVVFQDRQGKLKSSNVALDDLLTKNITAVDNTVALFQDGKLKPGALISTITDNLVAIKTAIDILAALRSQYEVHVSRFTAVRKNLNRVDDAVDKCFGKRNIKPEDVKTALVDITNEIDLIRESINQQSLGIDTNIGKLNKIKIPHDVTDIRNIVYTVQYKTINWIKGDDNFVLFKPKVTGVYRFSIISQYNFNIRYKIFTDVAVGQVRTSVNSEYVINTIIKNINTNDVWNITISATNESVVREQIIYVIEFVSDIPVEN